LLLPVLNLLADCGIIDLSIQAVDCSDHILMSERNRAVAAVDAHAALAAAVAGPVKLSVGVTLAHSIILILHTDGFKFSHFTFLQFMFLSLAILFIIYIIYGEKL